MSRQRNLRKRREASEDGDEPGEAEDVDLRQKLEATRDLQKHRQRAQGLGVDSLAGASMQGGGGGQTEARRDDGLMRGYIKGQEEQAEEDDPERQKYIREQLNRRLGRAPAEAPEEEPEASPQDDLYAIPEALRAQKANRQDVSTMIGIVEIPLTLEQKLQHIEQTEAAKARLLAQAAAARSLEDEDEGGPPPQPEGLRRVSYPLHFGRHSQKEQDWQQRALQKPSQPRERKKRRGG